jgi:hypothetical protein
MEKETGKNKDIPENPLLARLLVVDGAANAITLRGYVGRSTAEGYVNLYPKLDDLSESLEIAQADILHFSEVPESVMPYGAMILWVKKDAQITHRRGKTPERANLDEEVRAGRLRIRVPKISNDLRRVCASFCFGGCRPCQSGCTPCH